MNQGNKPKALKKVATAQGLDYYTGVDENFDQIFNVVPAGSPAPVYGYWHKNYILAQMKAPDMFVN